MDPAAKRQRRDEEDVDDVDDIDNADDQMDRILSSLNDVQHELEKIQDESSDAVLAVEQKYNEIRRPVYAKRNEYMSMIPDFWLQCFTNHPFLSEYLNEDDRAAFASLYELDVVDNDDVKSGYKIVFTWHENPYFTNEVLQKEYQFAEDGTPSVESTPIDWKEGMDITMDGGSGDKRGRESFSFFRWFSENDEDPNSMPDEVASHIKDDLWPNPLKYYLMEEEEGDDEDILDEDEDDLGDEDDFGEDEEGDEGEQGLEGEDDDEEGYDEEGPYPAETGEYEEGEEDEGEEGEEDEEEDEEGYED